MIYKISSLREECSGLICALADLQMFKLTPKEAFELNKCNFNLAIDNSTEENLSHIAQKLSTGVRKNNGFFTVPFEDCLPLFTEYTGFVLLCDSLFSWARVIYIDGYVMDFKENGIFRGRVIDKIQEGLGKAYMVVGQTEKVVDVYTPRVIDAVLAGQEVVDLSNEEAERIQRILGTSRFSKHFHRSDRRQLR